METDVDKSGAIFSRSSTGLVRDVSPFSALVFNMIPALPPYVLAVGIFWVLGVFPGANIYVALLIALGLAAILALAYGMFSSAIPRSGGDYVLVSRTLHPVLGVISSVCMSIASILSAAFVATVATTIGLGPGLTVIGLVSNSTTLVDWGTTIQSSAGWQFLIGAVVIGLVTLVLASGWRTVIRFQNFCVGFALLGLLVAGIILLVKSQSGFESAFNGFAGNATGSNDAYQGLINAAHKNGIDTSPGASLSATWPAVGSFMGFSIFSWWSIHIAGEVRRANTWRTPFTMVGAAVASTLILMLFTALFFKLFGHDFFTAANALNGTKDYPFAVPPFYTFLVSIASGSTVVAVFLELSLFAAILAVLYVQMIQPVRALFSFAFDGLLPLSVANVSRKRHVPITALVIVFVLSMAGLLWAVNAEGFFTLLGYAILFLFVSMALLAVSAILLPVRLPEVWRASATSRLVAGIPLVSIAGVAALVTVGIGVYMYLHYPGLGITTPGAGLLRVAIVVIASALFYYLVSWYRSQRGVSLSEVYGEIPEE